MDCLQLTDAYGIRVTVHDVWPKPGSKYELWQADCSIAYPKGRPYQGRVVYSCNGQPLDVTVSDSTFPDNVLLDLSDRDEISPASETMLDALYLAWERGRRMFDVVPAETPQSERAAE